MGKKWNTLCLFSWFWTGFKGYRVSSARVEAVFIPLKTETKVKGSALPSGHRLPPMTQGTSTGWLPCRAYSQVEPWALPQWPIRIAPGSLLKSWSLDCQSASSAFLLKKKIPGDCKVQPTLKTTRLEISALLAAQKGRRGGGRFVQRNC